MVSNHFQPSSVDYEHIKKRAFLDQQMLVVSIDDARLTWADREYLKRVGEKLFGTPPRTGRELLRRAR